MNERRTEGDGGEETKATEGEKTKGTEGTVHNEGTKERRTNGKDNLFGEKGHPVLGHIVACGVTLLNGVVAWLQ